MGGNIKLLRRNAWSDIDKRKEEALSRIMKEASELGWKQLRRVYATGRNITSGTYVTGYHLTGSKESFFVFTLSRSELWALQF